MTAALIVVSLTLQVLLYGEPYHIDWLTRQWLTVNLPRMVAIAFGFSMVIGVAVEVQRRASDQRASRDLSSSLAATADRDVPRSRQFDPPRRDAGGASRPRSHHALL